jgi:DNA-directed RNA polymerase subunit RPC12/RpoP
MQQYRCPKCGASISPDMKFCVNCGSKLSWMKQPAAPTQYVCPVCNAPVIINSRNCSNCGTQLSWQTQPQTPPPPIKPPKIKAEKEDSGGNKVLKGIGIAVLSLLLFISLSAFSPAFMVDRTVLNPDFVAAEVDSLEIAPMVEDVIDEALPEEIPAQIKNALSSTVVKLEPSLKQGINSAVYYIYDYIKGKRNSPELLHMLRSTILSDEFLTTTIDELDTGSLIKSFVQDLFTEYLPAEISDISAYIDSMLEEFLTKHEAWIKEQLKSIAIPVADYIVGDIKSFNVEISLQPVLADLKEMILQNLPSMQIPGLSDLPPEMVEIYLDDMLDEYLPSSFEFRNTMIGAGIPAQVASAVAEIENTLTIIRTYVGYFQTGYILLIVFMLLLIAGIILIYHEVKGATRTLGIIFLISGAIDLIFLLLMKGLVTDQLRQAITDLPTQIQTWLIQLVNNFTTPMQILSICFIVGGIVLIIVSIIYKPRQLA